MIERWTRRIVAMGRSHKWLRPLTLFGLLGLFGGAALAEWTARRSARAWRAAGECRAAYAQQLSACRERRARSQARQKRNHFRSSHRPASRVVAAVLSVCMMFTLLPSAAFAAETETSLCEHHSVHTVECRYQEAIPGQPCAHEHTADCCTGELVCGLEEGAVADNGEPYTHTQDCCALDCPHERGMHDESCGYTEAVEAVPCGFTCEICDQLKAPVCLCDPQMTEPEGVHTNPDCPFYAEPDEVDALCAAIDALPTVEELYANAPGDADPEFDAWVAETRALLAEIPALWEQVLAVSADTSAMERITDVRAGKLEELNYLAERLGEAQTLNEDAVAYIGVTPYTTLQAAFDAATSTNAQNPTIIELAKDLTFGTGGDITAGINVPTGKAVKLTSKGNDAYTISRQTANDTKKDYYFKVYNGCTLILENVILDGKNLATNGSQYFVAVAGADLVLEKGAVLRNNTSSAIRAGTAQYDNPISAITMNGGEISGNSARGIALQPNWGSQSGKTLRFTMNGGVIKENTANDSGAGVWGTNSSLSGCTAEIIIHGGDIINNASTCTGGNTVKGGGGVYCDSVFIMDNGNISNNTAGIMGGGVYLSSGISKASITGGTIANNTAKGLADDANKGKGNNLYVNKTQNLSLSPTQDMDGIFLYLGASLKIPSKLEHTITLEGAYQRNTPMLGLPVASGSNHEITADDLAKFSYKDNVYGFSLDTDSNQIKLANPSYPVTFLLTGMEGNTDSKPLPASIEKGEDLTVQLVASSGYKLPAASVTVKVGNVELTANEYQLSNQSSACSIAIGQAKITGAVEITAVAQAKGSDATLSALTYWYANPPGDVAVPGFSSNAQNPTYNVVLPASVAKDATIYVDKTKSDNNATSSTDPGLIKLANGQGTWSVTITSEDGTKTNTYTINFTTAPPYTVTFDAGGGSVTPASAQTGTDGKLQSLPTPTRSNHRFDGWFTAATGGMAVTTATVFTQNSTIYAHWTYMDGSDGDFSGGSDNNNSTPPTIETPPAAKPDAPTMAEIEIKAQGDGQGGAEVTVPTSAVESAIQKAQEEAKRNGTLDNGIAVQVNVAANSPDIDSLTVNLPKVTQELIIDNKVQTFALVLERPDITLSLNLASVQEINRQANADVQLTATRLTDTASLSGEARAVVGDRPVFRLTATYRGGQVTNFGAGSVFVEIPYTLQKGELASNVYAIYVDDNGKVTYLTNSIYDAKRGVVMFTTDHFSLYGIGYKAPVTFSDIKDHWAEDDIQFVAARGLLVGIGNGSFSPDGAMTRGMFVTALGRLADIDPAGCQSGTFTDVKADAYYAPYVEWANQNNIVNGTGDGQFSPDQSITREQMAAILVNYAKATGLTLPKVHEENTFADSADISTWAKDAVKSTQMAGVLVGKGNNHFDPQGTATRAEVAAMLRRFLELMIDQSTAQG